LLPFGDFVAWCLMPNHYHWQFYVRKAEIQRKVLGESVEKIEYLRRKKKYGINARPVDPSKFSLIRKEETIGLNEAIGVLQKSYTRAINKEKEWSGSLFRKEFKAKDGWIDEFITVRKRDGKLDYRFIPGTDYAYQCFCYIHDNPENCGLVKRSIDWEYSSAKDYAGLRRGTLCNLEMGRRLMEFL
jgi:putative transposase